MGITRLEALPEHQLRAAIAAAKQADKERKGAPQHVSGANLTYFVTETQAEFDWSGRLSKRTGSGFGYEEFFITLTSGTQVVPLADVALTLFYSTDGVSWEEYTYARGITENFSGTNPQISRFLEPLQGAEVPPRTSAYFLSIYGQPDARVALKFQALGTDELTISVARIA